MSSGVWKTAAAVSDMPAESSVSMAASSTRIQRCIGRVCLQESSKGTIYGTNIGNFPQIQELAGPVRFASLNKVREARIV